MVLRESDCGYARLRNYAIVDVTDVCVSAVVKLQCSEYGLLKEHLRYFALCVLTVLFMQL